MKIIEPTWLPNNDLGAGNDIAILQLSSSVTNVTPALLYGSNDEVGKVGTNVGFGSTGTGQTGATQPAGTKRAGNNMIGATGAFYSLSNKLIRLDFNDPSGSSSSLGSATPLGIEFLIARGDSGGGLSIDPGGVAAVAGVHSFIASYDGNTDASYRDITGSTRVSQYHDSILTNAPGAQVVPEPASLLLLGMGLLARRRGRAA